MLKLTKVGNALKVEGQNHPLFPNDGYLMLPLNSVIVVTDESDIVTFRSSSTNDVLFSGLISDITIQGQSVTKENVGDKFGAISNTISGGGLTPEQEQRLNNAVQITDYNADKEAQATIDDSQNTAIEGKQDKINDLDTIREGAGKGATALQEETDPVWNADKGNYYTKSETDGLVNEAKASANSAISIASSAEGIASAAHSRADEALEQLENKADKSAIPSLDGYATESWVEGKGYLTEHQDISGKLDKTEAAETYQPKGNYATKDEIPSLNGYATEEWVESKGYLTEHQDISGKANVGDSYTKAESDAKYLTEHQSLESYAKTADVNAELEKKQDVISDLDAIRDGAAKGATAIQEHQDISGKQDVITDLAEIRDGSALGKTALQSFTETDPTVPAHVKAITEEDIAKWNQGGGGEPNEYIKSAEKSPDGNTLTLTKKDGSEVLFSPSTGGGGDGKTEIVSLNNYRPVNVFDGGWIQIENGTVLQNYFGIGSKTSRRNPNIQINEDTLWSINVAFRTPSELGVSEQVLVDIISTNTTTYKWRLHIGIQNEGRLRFLIVENNGNTLIDFEGMMPDIEPDTNYILTMYTDYPDSSSPVTFYAKLYNQKTGHNSEVLNTSYGHNIIIPSNTAKIQFGQNASGRGDTFQGLLDASQCSMYIGNKPLFRTVDKFVGQIDWNDTITLEGTLEDGSTKKFILIGIEG